MQDNWNVSQGKNTHLQVVSLKVLLKQSTMSYYLFLENLPSNLGIRILSNKFYLIIILLTKADNTSQNKKIYREVSLIKWCKDMQHYLSNWKN